MRFRRKAYQLDEIPQTNFTDAARNSVNSGHTSAKLRGRCWKIQNSPRFIGITANIGCLQLSHIELGLYLSKSPAHITKVFEEAVDRKDWPAMCEMWSRSQVQAPMHPVNAGEDNDSDATPGNL